MVRATIEFWEFEKPDLGEPVWTDKQRARLVNGFLIFIGCSDFAQRFKEKSNLDAQFWRTLCHRTFAYGDPADAKINSWDCRKEFFRLKEVYVNLDQAQEYSDDLVVEESHTEDFALIEEEKWGGSYGGEVVGGGQRVILGEQVEGEGGEDDVMTDVGQDDGEEEGQKTPTAPKATPSQTVAVAVNGSPIVRAQDDGATTDGGDRSTITPSNAAPSIFSQQLPPAPLAAFDPAYPPELLARSQNILRAIENIYTNDTLLTDNGKINWHALIDHQGMKAKHPELITSYNLMIQRATQNGRVFWMKRMLEEYVDMGGSMLGDLDGCFTPGI